MFRSSLVNSPNTKEEQRNIKVAVRDANNLRLLLFLLPHTEQQHRIDGPPTPVPELCPLKNSSRPFPPPRNAFLNGGRPRGRLIYDR